MMVRIRKVCLTLSILSAALMSGSVASATDMLKSVAGRYSIADQSTIAFSVSQVGGGGIDGRFGDFSGTFELHADNVAKSKVDFLLHPASISTGNSGFDDFLKSQAVFNIEQFQDIRFRSTLVTRTGDDTAQIDGMLSALGKTLPVSFNVVFSKAEGRSVSFHVTGKMMRSRFGIEVGTPIFSNMVALDLDITGKRS